MMNLRLAPLAALLTSGLVLAAPARSAPAPSHAAMAEWSREYKVLDQNQDGRLTRLEFTPGVRRGKLDREWFTPFDKNKDGVLSKAEFLGGLRQQGLLGR
jgi:hypothetical protein